MGNAGVTSCIQKPAPNEQKQPHYEKDSTQFIQRYFLENTTKPMKIKLKKGSRPEMTPELYYNHAEGRPTKCTVLIINNASSQSEKGAAVDMKNLNQLFSQIKAKVKIINKLKTQEMLKSLRSFAQNKNLKDFDMCIVVVIGDVTCGPNSNNLTEISGTDKQFVSKLEIVKQFTDEACPQLLGKPKLFLFQGHYFKEAANDEYSNAHKGGFNDMFIANSILMGALQQQQFASYYIQALCHVFMNHVCEMDIESMIKLIEQVVYTHDRSTQHTHYDNIRFKHCFINVS